MILDVIQTGFQDGQMRGRLRERLHINDQYMHDGAEVTTHLPAGGITLNAAEYLAINIRDGKWLRIVHNSYDAVRGEWPCDNRWHSYPLYEWREDTPLSRWGSKPPYNPRQIMYGRIRFRIVEPVYFSVFDCIDAMIKARDDDDHPLVSQLRALRREMILNRLAGG